MTEAILELHDWLGSKLKTLTVDHGKEFANYQAIEAQTGVALYIHRTNEEVTRIVTEFYGDLFLRVRQLKRLVIKN